MVLANKQQMYFLPQNCHKNTNECFDLTQISH